MFTPGTVLDERYEIIAPLGAGGMGEVHRARRLLLGDEVAVKVVHASFDASSEHKTRFLRESRACAQLRHPNIVSILDFNIGDDGQPYLVMELLSGPSLRDELELNGPMPPQAAAEILKSVCSAVQLAHDRGITHRDLKPANIVAHRYETGERVYKVIDFGLAAVKEASDATRLTHPHAFIGTLAYAAPEQLRGEPADARRHVYALGVIAYEMATGQKPFTGQNMAHLISAEGARPAPPSRARADLPAPAGNCILKAMAFRPQDRYPGALEFAEDFARGLDPEPGPTVTFAQKKPIAKITGRLEMAHVLFTDLVGYSTLSMDLQRQYLDELQQVVRSSPRYCDAEKAGEIIRLPTGDGMALAFFADPSAPAQCAIEIAAGLRERPHLRLRMGIHSGPVYRVADINANTNVSGGGINTAQRVMDCGDAGHILVSKTSADVLSQLNEWSGRLTALGEHAVKHGVLIHIFNLVTETAGNRAVPQKLTEAAQQRPASSGTSRRAIPIVAALALVLAAAGGWFVWQSSKQPAPPPVPSLELHYSIQVQRMRDGAEYGAPVRLVGEMLFERDYRIAIEFFTTATGQLYILNQGKDASTGQTTLHVLQPRPLELPTVIAGSMVRIPSAGWFQFDAAAGKEILYVVWSKAPVPELETARDLPPDPEARLVALKTPEHMNPVLAFLGRHKEKQVTILKNEQARRTELRTSEKVLVHEIALEHQ